MFGDGDGFPEQQRRLEPLEPAKLHGRSGNRPRYPEENFDGELHDRVAVDPAPGQSYRPKSGVHFDFGKFNFKKNNEIYFELE